VKELRSTHSSILGCNETFFSGELRSWHQYLKRVQDPPTSALDTLSHCKEVFPTVRCALGILATLPVTTVTGERSFSTLRLLKSYLRSANSEDRLNGLAMLLIHQNVPCTSEEVLNELAKNPRRLDFKS